MGLDMYMFRVRKLTEEEVTAISGQHTNEIAKKYHFIDKSAFDDDPEPLSDLLPYVTQIAAVDTVFDYNRCFVDHGVNCRYTSDEDDGLLPYDTMERTDRVVGSWCGPAGAGWSFASGARIDITAEEYKTYLYDRVVEIYVWKSEDVGYWRKFYDLDDFIQNLRIIVRTKKFVDENGRVPTEDEAFVWRTENCGYYELCREEKDAVLKYLAENEAPYTAHLEDGCLDNDDAIMYHAWW